MQDNKSGAMMVPKTYRVLEMAVENGVTIGFNRAYKWTNNPSDEKIKEAIAQAVLQDICSWFHIDAHLTEEE